MNNNWEFGIADMVINFVPGSGNPMGIQVDIWESMTELERLSNVLFEISKSNFDYLELAVPWINEISNNYKFNDIKNLIKENNLTIKSYCSLMPKNIKTVGNDVDYDLIKNYLTKVFKNCSELGGDTIVFGSGDSRYVPDDYSHTNARIDIINFLKIADDIIKVNNYSLKVVIEPLNKEECNIINSITEAYEIAKEIDSPNIGILIDTYHASSQTTNFLEEISIVHDKLMHIHLAQPKDRKWPGQSMKYNHIFTFTNFFEQLKKYKYNGKLTVECNFDNLPYEIDKCSLYLNNQKDNIL